MKPLANAKQEGVSPSPEKAASNDGAPNGQQSNGSASHGSNQKDPSTLTPSRAKALKIKEKLSKAKYDLQLEKGMKRKLYQGLVKLASELKDAREECKVLKQQSERGDKNWYEGGMWRGPELLPGIRASARHRMATGEKIVPEKRSKDAVSLSDLFFDLVIVTAFTRVGVAIQDRGGLDGASLAYFCVFWLIWGKEASFSTRFDTTDLSSRVETLLTCFAVLFGSLSSTAMFDSGDATRMMIVAAFIALLHFFLHLRVWYWFRDVSQFSEMICVKQYAQYVMALTAMEFLTWMVGTISLSETSSLRAYIFLIAIILSFRVPRTFLPNDFHAACSKRGVLFILLLGFVLQSIVLVASPFFDYQMPSSEQYCFLGLVCFLLFCIKLLYVDDSFSVQPSDHALLVSRAAGFFFHIGQLCLLLSTTILGAGLNLLTHSYLAATASLPDNAKALVCNGFAGVVLSIGFIKSMHLRRVPLNPVHRQLFYAAYGTQVVVLIVVVYAIHSISMNRFMAAAMMNELEMLGTLCSLALFLLIISWLDEAVELNIYGEGDAREFRVHPFGLWTCLKPGSPEPPLISSTSRMSHLSTRLKDSNANLFDSQFNLPIYGSVRSTASEDDEERVRLVKFSDQVDMNEIDEESMDVVV